MKFAPPLPTVERIDYVQRVVEVVWMIVATVVLVACLLAVVVGLYLLGAH